MTSDLLHAAELKDVVCEAYSGLAATGGDVAEELYEPEELALVPQTAIEHALGVGNHLRFARLTAGDTVLDLGAGAGIDSILAAHRVG